MTSTTKQLPRAYTAPRRHEMKTPDDVVAIVRLHELGWGSRRIARELGIARSTVIHYIREGGWTPYKKPDRVRCLEGHEEWLRAQFRQHRGNAVVVQRELKREHGIDVTLRTIQRAVKPYRQELLAEAKATVRFETQPGRQLQVDFGQVTVLIGGRKTRVHLAVMTLGYSRRVFVCAWPCERQAQWLRSFELAFEHFGGVPAELLTDNPRALVLKHDSQTREVVFHPVLLAFCKHWGIEPKACAPYRARTKGKTERSVGYIKRNAIAGYEFESWEHLETHLAWWMREVADVRVHGTTGDRPLDRFQREAEALQPLASRPSFQPRRTLQRRVQSDCCVEVDTNHYSVPYVHLGKEVLVELLGTRLEVRFAGELLAEHTLVRGRGEWVIDKRHLDGVVRGPASATSPERQLLLPIEEPELLRPLSVYEDIAGGAL
jgi:transposase